MLRSIFVVGALALASLGMAQVPVAPKGDWTGVDRSKIGADALKRGTTVKGTVIHPLLAPTGPAGVFGKPNPEMEGYKFKGVPLEPKPGEIETLTVNPAWTEDIAFLKTFDGIPQSGLVPADTDHAAGGGYLVEVINSRFRFYTKCGTQLYDNYFANWVGAPYNGYFLYDPRVCFDPWTSRWLMLIHCTDDPTRTARLILFVSSTSNPLDSWTYYAINSKFTFGTDTWCDYYDLGYGVNGVYMSGNQFSWTTGDFGHAFFGMQKSDVYNGGSVTYWTVTYGTGSFTPAYTPRPADAYYSGYGSDVVFVGLDRSSGTVMRLWRWTDPWASGAFTITNVTVPAYSAAPTAWQPSGRTWYGFDARLLDAVITRKVADSNYHLLTCQNLNVSGEMGVRLYDIDVPGNAVRWTYNVWGGANTTFTMPSPTSDYDGNSHWAMSYASNSVYPSAGTLIMDDNVVGGFYLTRTGTANCNTGRWGDYAGACIDWDDWFYNGSYTNMRFHTYAMWQNGGVFGTESATSISTGVNAGILTGADGNPLYRRSVGSTSVVAGSMTISNTGDVGFPYEITTWTGWVDPTSATRGEIFAGQTITLNFQSNANAGALAYGRHTATATVRNCYNGATVTRNVMTLSLGMWICPDATVYIYEGESPDGDGTSVCTSNNDYYTLFNNSATLATDFFFQFSGVIDGSDSAYSYNELAAARGGLQVQIYTWNSDGAGWVLQNGYVCPTADAWFYWGSGIGNADKFVHPNGQAWVRIKTSPINDEQPAFDGWQTRVDTANFWTYP